MKFQDSSFNGLKVTVGTKSVTHARTHAPKAICPINFFKVGGIISDTIFICLTSCFVLFCLPSLRLLLSIYYSLSICLSACPNLHFGIDFGRNDPGPNRPTYLSRNDPPQNLAETTQA